MMQVSKMKKAELEAAVLAYQAAEAERESGAAEAKQRQRVAMIVGGVASALVFLSVWHLMEGVAHLTGTPWALALLLAIGIDLGMVSSEVAELLCGGCEETTKWARCYMVMATLLSMAINSFEFYRHAPEGSVTKMLAIGFGIMLPLMIFVLAKVAGHLYHKS